MKTRQPYIAFFLISVLLSACKKDPPADLSCWRLPLTHECTDTETYPSNNTGIMTFYHDSTYFERYSVNPNDPNEIAVYKNSTKQLIKINLTTGDTQVLTTGTWLYGPRWGRNGWILISTGYTFRIKENGDSLTQLTYTDADFAPEWNYEGTKFVTQHSNNGYGTSVIYDFNGVPLDTFPEMVNGNTCWQNQGNLMVHTMGATGNAGLIVYDVTTKQSHTLFNDGPNKTVYAPFWYPDGVHILYSTTEGIFKINYQTRERTCLRSICSNDIYSKPFITDTEIFYNYIHTKQVSSSKRVVSTRLVRMDLTSYDEQAIQLPNL